MNSSNRAECPTTKLTKIGVGWGNQCEVMIFKIITHIKSTLKKLKIVIGRGRYCLSEGLSLGKWVTDKLVGMGEQQQEQQL
jgi:hypothetical protein